MTAEEKVRAVLGWPSTGCATDGWMRSALEVLGVHARGRPLSRPQLVRLCRDNGLDLTETTTKTGDESRR